MNRLIAFLTLCLTLLNGAAFSQATTTDNETEVKLVLEKLFLSMEKGDTVMLKECFTEEVSLASIFTTKDGKQALVREYSIADFVKAVGGPRKDIWYEEYWNLDIKIDGDLASAWCDFAFYLGNTFSHCGVDAFHLHKEKDGWKIFHLSDTRRKSGCDVPANIQQKHK